MEIIKSLFLVQLFSLILAHVFKNLIEEEEVINKLRRSNDEDDRDVLLVLLPEEKELRTKMSIKSDRESMPLSIVKGADVDIGIADLKLNKKQKEILRKRWRSSCDKKASKVCMKACKSTYKIVCGSYKCRKAMKKSFKRECKRNCKAKFVSSKYTDTE